YPRLRELRVDPVVVDESEIEHECLRGLMDRLVDMQSDDPLFEARLAVLSRWLDSHFKREMDELVPLLRGLDLGCVGQDMADRRDELLAALAEGHGLRFENEAADPVGAPPR
ncbi:MAG: hemerythrin domain-containing protein, partial [Aquabacterium sp.]